jgi:hypothetical protein
MVRQLALIGPDDLPGTAAVADVLASQIHDSDHFFFSSVSTA